ncbi:C40 family peptidase [Halalkalibacter oceani]|uniref:C40 family peptidase n=1 Tax=Halalkalibacter oceani TaxID=1653776 RepID=UPI003399C2A0
MKTKTKGTLLLSAAMLGTVMYMPLNQEKALAAPKKGAPLDHSWLLQFGRTDAQVMQLQSYLKAFHYYDGAIDGFFGLMTRQAVSIYQRNHALKIDGVAGPETSRHLRLSTEIRFANQEDRTATIQQGENNPEQALIAAAQSPTLKGSSIQLLKEGAKGASVKKTQQVLEEYGYYQGVDGIFGPRTTAAVKQFQQAHGLQVDGIIGPETKKALKAPQVKAAAISAEPEEQQVEQQVEQPVQNSLIQTALSLQGIPYAWGGTSTAGFDCSGFIQYVFRQHNKQLPRTTRELFRSGQSVSQLKTGDLVFFSTAQSGPSHAGIYLGNRQFIHAGSSTGVTVSSLDQPYWSHRYLGGKRF